MTEDFKLHNVNAQGLGRTSGVSHCQENKWSRYKLMEQAAGEILCEIFPQYCLYRADLK